MNEKNNAPKLLHIENVYKQYGEKMILDNIDLIVNEGEFCTVVGPSGCGKSTLLRLILGQEPPTEGRLLLDGKPVGYPNTDRGIVYQRYSLFPHLTVLENVMLGPSLKLGLMERRRRKTELRDEAMHYLQHVNLHLHGNKYPHELSGGMQQRVAIAQALIMKPRILLMDEPFGALDPQTREDMQIFLLELWEQEKMTIFFVTHDLEEALYLGTRIFALSQYYSDDRGHDHKKRGAKIVSDHKLPSAVASNEIKHTPEFLALLETIRKDAFEKDHLQHVREFNLKHPDSYQTLTEEESNHRG
ncbi:MAG: ABC transporter ATP-binding protein [Gammaproteobacteria bacterium]|nr:ABC transporter ATP-binding protein [Gammaproteobacteria bacterium]MDH5651973.1 ABC transporter ATP-binding protein [Gammaproteobacteria bacterium]